MGALVGLAYGPHMAMTRSERVGLVAGGVGIAAMAIGVVLFFAHFHGAFDWALGELLMELGVGACFLSSIAVTSARRRSTR
jgi:hypothetical protein